MRNGKWAITRDELEDNDFIVEEKFEGEGTKFRIRDDDDEIYFYGIFLGDDWKTEKGFEPLDEYGEAYGCVTIEYLEGGKWEVL